MLIFFQLQHFFLKVTLYGCKRAVLSRFIDACILHVASSTLGMVSVSICHCHTTIGVGLICAHCVDFDLYV